MPELDLDTWLKANDVSPEATIRFSNAGSKGKIAGEGDKPGVETFEIGVLLSNGDKRLWTMNMTSQRAVAQTYGTNTDDWVNKLVKVYVTNQNVRGTMKDVIYARIPEAQ